MSDFHVVSIVQRRLPHYRVPLFIALRKSLREVGIVLRLLHGEGTKVETTKNDLGHIDWAEALPTKYFLGGKLCWQPFSHHVAGSCLVIIPQENALLANHLALFRKPAPLLAFWGHGANLQGNSQSYRERYKRWSTRRVDWYFAYTKNTVNLVVESGFPRQHTTQLNNAIDVEELQNDMASLNAAELAGLRLAFGLCDGPVGLFIGSLYSHKRIDFLLAAAEQLRAKINDFQLLVIGDGPHRRFVEAASFRHPYIRYIGARKGSEKAGALKLATIIMNPGLIGLGILDSFAAGVPIITTDCGLHSPEIAYLEPHNGVITSNDLQSYVAACARLLTNDIEHSRLSAGCKAAANLYTLPKMVENFTQGIIQAIELKN
ncbi:glycosyltransferase [Rhodobacterales bacterium LSUCC0031]|nr:glycosyltransferase [Rhodobacterales bacterium LSUCC0031]